MLKRYRVAIAVFFVLGIFSAALLYAQNRIAPGPYGVLFRNSTATNTATLTTTQMVGLLTGTPTAAAAYTTPTATQICSSLPQVAQVSGGTNTNFAVPLFVENTSTGPNTITMTAGTGVTLVGTATVAQNTVRHYLIVPTACPNPATGSPTAAVSLISVSGAGTF